MSGSDSSHHEPGESGSEGSDAQGAWVSGVWGDPRLSASKLADANEGSRNARRPWLMAVGWVGGVVVVITALILILR